MSGGICTGRVEIVGLVGVLSDGFIGAWAVVGDDCWLANCLRRSMISLSISAFLLRLPTLLKLDSILQVSLRR